jgi:hypothetical protein
MNDTVFANGLFVEAERPHELLYFFSLASSHLYEAAETLRQAHREWEEVRGFVASLDQERQEEFAPKPVDGVERGDQDHAQDR